MTQPSTAKATQELARFGYSLPEEIRSFWCPNRSVFQRLHCSAVGLQAGFWPLGCCLSAYRAFGGENEWGRYLNLWIERWIFALLGLEEANSLGSNGSGRDLRSHCRAGIPDAGGCPEERSQWKCQSWGNTSLLGSMSHISFHAYKHRHLGMISWGP